MFKAFDVRDVSLESLNKLIATDLIKYVNKSEITVAQNETLLPAIMHDIILNPDFDVKVNETKL